MMKKMILLSFSLITLSIISFGQSENHQDLLRQIHKGDSLRNRIREDSSVQVFRKQVKQDSTKLVFIVKPYSGEVRSEKILLSLEFKNVSNGSIKILEPFDENMEVHFYLSVYCETGNISAKYYNSLMLYNGGFIDYPAFYKYKYIEIPKAKSYKHTINLTEIIKSTYNNLLLPKGVYRVAMSYTNGKGSGCIIGRFKSRDIKFTITKQMAYGQAAIICSLFYNMSEGRVNWDRGWQAFYHNWHG